MAAIADTQQALSPPPGNLESTEHFPDFLFTRDSTSGPVAQDIDNQEQTSHAERCNLYSPAASAYSRSSTISSVSTAPSSIDSGDVCTHEYSKQRFLSAPPSDFCTPLNQASPGASPTSRRRRDKHHLHAARLERSGANGRPGNLGPTNKNHKSPRFQRSSSSPADALAAIEPPHDQGLVRMAYAEQQRWITVQQKTFTKW